VVAAWLRHHDRANEDDFRAWEVVSDARPNEKWRLMLAVVKATDLDSAIALVGLGPLEELLGNVALGMERDDESWADVIVQEAAISDRLRRALARVWPAPFDPPELWARLDEVIGLERPRSLA